MEFEDHRLYHIGDDLRHLDRHVHARLGQHVVKEFSTSRQLPITILLDASRSMGHGQPDKLAFGKVLAAGLAYVGLAGGDHVLLGTFAGERVDLHPRVQGVRRLEALIGWLERVRAHGETEFGKAARALSPRLQPQGMTVVISDWLAEHTDEALRTLHGAKQELVCIQLLSPEEVEPDRLGSGEARFLDSETGHEVEVSLDPSLYRRYIQELEACEQQLRRKVIEHEGRYWRVRSDDDVERLFLNDWRRGGLIG